MEDTGWLQHYEVVSATKGHHNYRPGLCTHHLPTGGNIKKANCKRRGTIEGTRESIIKVASDLNLKVTRFQFLG